MSVKIERELTPVERWEDLPRMMAEMQLAVREAILRHKQAGNPICTWRDGQVVWIQPEDIPVEACPGED